MLTKLHLTHLIFFQDLIEDVPGRTRKDPSVFSSPSDVKSVFKAVTRSSSKSYNIKDETSSKLENTLTKAKVKRSGAQGQLGQHKSDFDIDAS